MSDHQKTAAELLGMMQSGVTRDQKVVDIAALAAYRSRYSKKDQELADSITGEDLAKEDARRRKLFPKK